MARGGWRKTLFAALVAASAAVTVGSGGRPAAAAQGVVNPAQCVPAFIGVPGSGQHGFSKEMSAIAAELKSLSSAMHTPISSNPSLNYPAIAWYRYVVQWNNLTNSEATGTGNLLAEISSLRSGDCGQRTIMLAGYSQGAEVVINAVRALPAAARATVSVALIGNPSFTPSRAGDVDYNKAGQGIRPSGRQGRFLLPNDVLDRTIDICAKGDPICSFRPLDWLPQVAALGDGRSAHYAYVKLGYTRTAAKSLWKLRYKQPAPVIRTPNLRSGVIGERYVEFLDTTDARAGSWSVTAGALPGGLTLNSLGEIQGTPTMAGTTQVTVRFSDVYGLSVSGMFTVTIASPAPGGGGENGGPHVTVSTQPAALPSEAAGGGSGLGWVSCRGDGSCAATGYYLDANFTPHGLLETRSGSRWVTQSVPLPSDASPSAISAAGPVSCAAQGVCAAVGGYVGSGQNPSVNHPTQPMGLSWTPGGSWVAAALPLPADARVSDSVPSFNAVSCMTDGCVAVGQYVTIDGLQRPLVEELSGGVWTASTFAAPPDAYSNPDVQLTSVACADSISGCAAGGVYAVTGVGMSGLLATMNAGVWTAIGAVDQEGQRVPQIRAVACRAASECTAIATTSGSSPYVSRTAIEDFSDGHWTASGVPLPAGANAQSSAGMNDIACPSSTDCIATGLYTPQFGDAVSGTLYRGAGQDFTVSSSPIPVDANTATPDAVLTPLSCVSAASCGAVGTYSDSDGYPEAMFAVLGTDGSTAVVLPMPVDAMVASARDNQQPMDVSCWSPGQCVVVGSYTLAENGINAGYIATTY